LGELAMGARPDPDADFAAAVQELAAGARSRAAFLKDFGHRGSEEMELSQPRWDEDPVAVERLTTSLGPGLQPVGSLDATRQRLADEAKLDAAQRATLQAESDKLHTALALRETAKHYLIS